MAFLLLTVYCLLTLAASVLGGSLPLLVRVTHARMQLAISFVSGVMLGVGLLTMLPHALAAIDDAKETVWWLLGGFLVMFFLQRFLAVHHHVAPDDEHDHAEHHAHEHAHEHSAHLHAHAIGGDAACEQHDPLPAEGMLAAEKFSWSGAAMGLALHTAINGVALAAAVEAGLYEARLHHTEIWLAGLATFTAIVLHKPFDAMTITTLMRAGGWSARDCRLVNLLFALSLPLGVVLFYLGFRGLGGEEGLLLGRVLALSAGTFLCIAASDLLPEMQFHSHDRVKLTVSLLAGVLLAWLIEQLPH